MAVHDEFLELCAVSVTGELTDDERIRLDEHLSACPSCQSAFLQYQDTALTMIPQLAAEMSSEQAPAHSSWSEDRAERALLRRLTLQQQEDSRPPSTVRIKEGNRMEGFIPSPSRWGPYGMLYAAGILLFLSLAICAYRIGERRGAGTASLDASVRKTEAGSLASELSDAGEQRQALLSEISARDASILGLKQQIAKQSADRSAGSGISSREKSGTAKNASAPDPQTEKVPLPAIVELQKQLGIEEKGRADQSARANTLEARVTELTKQLQDRDEEGSLQAAAVRERDDLLQQRDKTITRQDELLAHDRDIRDLMSARDLYIAEVYDVAKTGQTNKPYGRVFYTTGKSLLFYAYDLDQQAGLKNASTFQAWGRRATGQEQPVNLGVLYQDSATNKRWVVRSEDSKTLEQIDAVFVTVEPTGGSRRPSSKPLLFAYLRIHPNHP